MYSRRQEPFPLLEGRLAALCQQLGESVVTAPGMATTQMIVPSLGFQRMSTDDRCKRNTTFHFRHCVIKSYKVNIKVICLLWFIVDFFQLDFSPCSANPGGPHGAAVAAAGTTNAAAWASEVAFHRRREGLGTNKSAQYETADVSALIHFISFYVFHSDRAKKQ